MQMLSKKLIMFFQYRKMPTSFQKLFPL